MKRYEQGQKGMRPTKDGAWCLYEEASKRPSLSEARAMRAEIKRLREALKPMTTGTFYISSTDVKRAKKALGIDA